MIFLDNASIQKPLQCAVDAFLSAPTYNPNSGHIAGLEARRALEKAREDIAECIKCEPQDIVFTSGATEACNLGIQNLAENGYLIQCDKRSHHAVSEPCRLWNEHFMNRWLHPQITIRFAFPLVDNETGKRIFVKKRMREWKESKIFVDATCAVGHIPVDFSALDVTMMAFGGHKFGAPLGVGALVVKCDTTFDPMLIGGGQEGGRRAGTQAVPLICAMAAALKWQTAHMEENLSHAAALNKRMRNVLGEDGGFRLTIRKEDVGNIEKVSPYILSGRFEGVPAEALVAAASSQGVCISAGAACSTGVLEPSPALLASGLTEEEAMQTIRISFSHENTTQEVEEAGRIIRECAKSLRTIG